MGCDHLNVKQAEVYATLKCHVFLNPLLKRSEFLNSCELPMYPFDHVIGLYFWVLPLKTLQVHLHLCWSWSDTVMTGRNHFARTALEQLPVQPQMAATAHRLCSAAGRCGQARRGSSGCSLKSHM